jgi:uncharacterized NAD(P)/FAD-binding protein YdhS
VTFVSTPTIAVVGAGASGVAAAVALLRTLRHPARVLLFDARAARGSGVAYGTLDPDHVLNVPASRMSAVADDPDDFVRWLREDGSDVASGWRAGSAPDAFVPRGLYASYLEDLLRRSMAAAAPGVVLELMDEEIDGLVRRGAGWRLHARSGAAWIANVVVLAVGYRPPTLPRGLSPDVARHARFISDPWRPGALDAVEADDPVLVLGAHLTMVDVALTLDRGEHRGGITALSPRGLVPLSHGPAAVVRGPAAVARGPADGEDPASPLTARSMLRRVRAEAAAEEARGGSWRSVADALRASVPRLWMRLPNAERSRFLRHLHPYWEIHRHRLPPSISLHVEAMRHEGKLRVVAGRVRSVAARGDGFDVAAVPRGGGDAMALHAAWIVNATGPTLRYADDPSPLLVQLFQSGVARPGPLGFGLDASADGALVDAAGTAHADLFTLGPPLRGVLWETTAVPEIRARAADLARSFDARIEAARGVRA